MKRIIYIASMTIIISAMFLVAYFYYLTFFPINVVTLNSFTVRDQEVQRGNHITYDLDFIKHKDYAPKVDYYLVDSITIKLDPGGARKPIGNTKNTLVKRIPTTILPGEYRLRIELEYPITQWRSIYYTWESNQFTVL